MSHGKRQPRTHRQDERPHPVPLGIHLGFRHARVRELNDFWHGVEASGSCWSATSSMR